ncbi:MAG: cell division protein FtsA [Omnitrophica WOR_2 bacterium RBG_13_41_10]|nr:MAG: cell division protein FtsA [Omnitrophica WOR_2 bacterium RBG_13_41_10]
MFNSYICALDIGCSKIAACVMQIQARRVANIFFESLVSKGIKKGVIVDSIDLVNTLSRILKNLKDKSGINIKSVYANICGQEITTKYSHAVIPLAERGNKVITAADINKVNEQARILGSSLEEEIIHQVPFSYTIDAASGLANPLGLYSHRLEVDLFLICAKLSSIQSLTRAVNQSGYEIKDLFLSGVATSKVIYNEDNKEGISILCDIGSDITEILIFNNAALKNIEAVSVGGNDLTEELAQMLKIPFDLAEDVKRSYGMIGDDSHLKKENEILVKKNDVYKTIKQADVYDIVNAKAKSICEAIKERIGRAITYSQIDSFVVVGRSILLEGFLETLENTLGIPIKVGRISLPSGARYAKDIATLINKDTSLAGQKYIKYISSLGIACNALWNLQSQAIFSQGAQRNAIFGVINKVKEVYQEYF